jgi:hypothetical protein
MINILFRLKNGLLPVLLLTVAVFSFGANSESGKKGMNKLLKINSDYLLLDYNNLSVPIDNKGIIGDVNDLGGRSQGIKFLFSGGFFMSGFSVKDTTRKQWGNGVMSASRINDYVPGPVGSSVSDSKNRMYLVTSQDVPFGDSWQDWKDAVANGAGFYDGDGDGIYNPVDKNGNGVWDADEDRPDLIGDFTAWCVYNDGKAKALRTFTDVDPQGIEVRQTVFGFSSKAIVGNMLFFRYSLVNTGKVADVLDSVYFSIACDPDLGDYNDDLVGCDTTLSCAYTYQISADKLWGSNPPCFMVDFFQGPVSYIPGVTFKDNNNNGIYDEGIDTPLKYAYNVKGKVLGIDTIPGAENLPLTSFTQYMQSHPTHGDPSSQYELRKYLIGGMGKDGTPVNPCKWAFGNGATFSDCGKVDPKFMYSGDPVAGTGWLNTTPYDQRQMSNSGPFKLEKNKPINIVVAYLIGQGTSGLNSVTVAKENDLKCQKVFDNNFPSPPAPPQVKPVATNGDGFIDLDWTTNKQITYRAVDNVLDIDRHTHGFYVTAYATSSKADVIEGVTNSKVIAYYQLNDSLKAIYQLQSDGGVAKIIPEAAASNKLDSVLYADPTRGRIKLRITSDPITGGPLVKGHEYFFVVTHNTLNYRYLVNKNNKIFDGRLADYEDISGSGIDEFESQTIRVVYGSDVYTPASAGGDAKQTSGASAGAFKYLVADKSKLTGNNYQVDFFIDSSATTAYNTFWRLTNKTTNAVLIDSSEVYNYDSTNYSGKIVEGFLPRVKLVAPYLNSPVYAPTKNQWFKDFLSADGTGAYYVGSDLSKTQVATGDIEGLTSVRSTAIRADRLRKVELRFGKTGKAYRYIAGIAGSGPSGLASARYAGGITAADTVGKDSNVKLIGQGFVDVPFQAWVKDDKYNEERQLAVAFLERRTDKGGTPDGVWDPKTSLLKSQEYIFVLDADYDPTGSQKEYTGGVFTTTTGTKTVWGDIKNGFTIPTDAIGVTDQQRKIAKSYFFNSMYVVGMQKLNANSAYTDGDILTLPLMTYPYTNSDKFTFTTNANGELGTDARKNIYNKVNVYPNPLFAYNPATSYTTDAYPDDPFVTFTNLPTDVTVKIYSLSGSLLRTLTQKDKKDGVTSPFLAWNLKNESGLRVASGMYMAIVSSPTFGDKVLKFGVILPQKQIRNY